MFYKLWNRNKLIHVAKYIIVFWGSITTILLESPFIYFFLLNIICGLVLRNKCCVTREMTISLAPMSWFPIFDMGNVMAHLSTSEMLVFLQNLWICTTKSAQWVRRCLQWFNMEKTFGRDWEAHACVTCGVVIFKPKGYILFHPLLASFIKNLSQVKRRKISYFLEKIWNIEYTQNFWWVVGFGPVSPASTKFSFFFFGEPNKNLVVL